MNYNWHLPSVEVLHDMYKSCKILGDFIDEYYWRPIINPNNQNLKINYDKEGKL